MISYVVSIIIRLITLIILLACILSWFPIFNQHKEPIATINRLFYALVKPFNFVPPIGRINISPLVAFFAYGFIGELIIRVLMLAGL